MKRTSSRTFPTIAARLDRGRQTLLTWYWETFRLFWSWFPGFVWLSDFPVAVVLMIGGRLPVKSECASEFLQGLVHWRINWGCNMRSWGFLDALLWEAIFHRACLPATLSAVAGHRSDLHSHMSSKAVFGLERYQRPPSTSAYFHPLYSVFDSQQIQVCTALLSSPALLPSLPSSEPLRWKRARRDAILTLRALACRWFGINRHSTFANGSLSMLTPTSPQLSTSSNRRLSSASSRLAHPSLPTSERNSEFPLITRSLVQGRTIST